MNAMRESTKAVLTKKAPVLSAIVGIGVGIVSSVYLIVHEIKETRRSIRIANIVEEDMGCVERHFEEEVITDMKNFDQECEEIRQSFENVVNMQSSTMDSQESILDTDE